MNRQQRRKEERTKKKAQIPWNFQSSLTSEETEETFKLQYVLHRPWADILYETTLPPTILNTMINLSDEVVADPEKTNWGNNLAGQVKDELIILPKMLESAGVLDFFGNMVREYVHQCSLQKSPPSEATYLESMKKNIDIKILSMWIVEQQPGEYNPLHVHTNCDISSVMYLKVPEFLPSEKPVRNDDGTIYFLGGSGVMNELKVSSLKSSPLPGAFFIFPSHMLHTVYPYKTNDNFARRSISFNANFKYFKPADAPKS